MKALFVSPQHSLADSPGGQQLCTREYLATLKAAGYEVEPVAFGVDRRPQVRLRRKLFPGAYRHFFPDSLPEQVLAAAQKAKPAAVFLNLSDVTPLAPIIRPKLDPRTQLVFLSHGAESVDYLHTLRMRDLLPPHRVTAKEKRKLADQLLLETSFRRHLDHVFTLAQFEAEIERWLGAKAVTWLPRTIPNQPLPWQPDPHRVGIVATIDHPPNREGLELFLPEFAKRRAPDLRLRLVGGPPELGAEVASRYPFIDYLGYIGDRELEAEAATWTSYVQPIHCYARGASTKLATGMGWRIPVVTTPSGCRGYQWRQGGPIIVDTPAELAEEAVRLARNADDRQAAQRAVAAAADSAPTIAEVAQLVRQALLRGASA